MSGTSANEEGETLEYRIERELMSWRGANGGIYTIHGAAAAVARLIEGDRVAPFQVRAGTWIDTAFGAAAARDQRERNHRFLEEALELVQATGCTEGEARQLVSYVFGRPAGDPAQEVGGVMNTLAALCLSRGLDMHACGDAELLRCWENIEAIRAKRAAKPAHGPLPSATAAVLEQAAVPFGWARTGARNSMAHRISLSAARPGGEGWQPIYLGRDPTAAEVAQEKVAREDGAEHCFRVSEPMDGTGETPAAWCHWRGTGGDGAGGTFNDYAVVVQAARPDGAGWKPLYRQAPDLTPKEVGHAAGTMAMLDLIEGQKLTREGQPDLVHIWSGEHFAYWRPGANGYTNFADEAGVWTRAEAERVTAGIRVEKKIQIRPAVCALPGSVDRAIADLPRDAFWRVGHDGPGPDPSRFMAQVAVFSVGRTEHIGRALADDPAEALRRAAAPRPA